MRRVNVQAAKPWGVQDGLRQNQTIGDNHGNIGTEGHEFCLIAGQFQRGGMVNRQPQFASADVHRAGPVGLATASGARRLGIDGEDLVRPGKRIQNRHRKIRRSHEDDFHMRLPSFPARASSILRFNPER